MFDFQIENKSLTNIEFLEDKMKVKMKRKNY